MSMETIYKNLRKNKTGGKKRIVRWLPYEEIHKEKVREKLKKFFRHLVWFFSFTVLRWRLRTAPGYR